MSEEGKQNSKIEIKDSKGVVIGDNNTVTIIFQNGDQHVIPFLAPPHPPYDLIGRDNLLFDLKQKLFTGGSFALSALNGIPGVGKTALALELAYDPDVLKHFSDGILWASLGRGGDVLSQLGVWGNAVGISSDAMAKLLSIEDRARAIHTTIGMRRMLLIVDDAWESIAASAFKVGGPNCAHLVTTRLYEVAGDFAGKKLIVVHELREEDGIHLLEKLAPDVVKLEPKEALELVRAVGGLPLALILIGKYLWKEAHAGQARRISATLKRLHKTEERLLLNLQQGILEQHPSLPKGSSISLQAVIQISDDALDKASRGTLRALSVFPSKPNTFSEEAAIEVARATPTTLDNLTASGLVETIGNGRYMIHQTIVEYARLKLKDRNISQRMVNYFVSYVSNNELNYKMIDVEFTNIVRSLEIAFQIGIWSLFERGVMDLYNYLDNRGLYEIADTQMGYAEQVLRSQNASTGLAIVLYNLGKIKTFRGEYKLAADYLTESISLSRNINDNRRCSLALIALGWVACELGDFVKARDILDEGLDLAQKNGYRDITSYALQGLGAVAIRTGNYTYAQRLYKDSLALAKSNSNKGLANNLMAEMGWIEITIGNYKDAEGYFREALNVARELEHHERICYILQGLGVCADKQGNYETAKTSWSEALDIARKSGLRGHISALLHNLGGMLAVTGDYELAKEYLGESLVVAREIGDRSRIGFLLSILGWIGIKQGNYSQARDNIREGLELARSIGYHFLVCDLLNKQGELCLEEQQAELALSAFLEALEIAQRLGSTELTSSTLYGLSRAEYLQGNTMAAFQYGRESLDSFERSGSYMVDEVRRWLRTFN
ncbi:MAG TPA: tetratricopeptide repeat protein [Anaerolineales bacterium]|nr:tetratricopeptide repeat protein [Anaerolineales bacterium]